MALCTGPGSTGPSACTPMVWVCPVFRKGKQIVRKGQSAESRAALWPRGRTGLALVGQAWRDTLFHVSSAALTLGLCLGGAARRQGWPGRGALVPQGQGGAVRASPCTNTPVDWLNLPGGQGFRGGMGRVSGTSAGRVARGGHVFIHSSFTGHRSVERGPGLRASPLSEGSSPRAHGAHVTSQPASDLTPSGPLTPLAAATLTFRLFLSSPHGPSLSTPALCSEHLRHIPHCLQLSLRPGVWDA